MRPWSRGSRKREGQRRDLQAKVEHADGLSRTASADHEATVEALRVFLGDWHGLPEKHPEAGRPILRRVLVGPILVGPSGSRWWFRATETFGAVLAGAIGLQPDEDGSHGDLFRIDKPAQPPVGSGGNGVPGQVQKEACPRRGTSEARCNPAGTLS